MDARVKVRGRAVVMQPDDGPSYRQPTAADGFAHLRLSPEDCLALKVSA